MGVVCYGQGIRGHLSKLGMQGPSHLTPFHPSNLIC